MKFEVINKEGRILMNTECVSCIPALSQLGSTNKAGYKFKLDNKTVSVKKLKEFVGGQQND